jgi:hypothetical protein
MFVVAAMASTALAACGSDGATAPPPCPTLEQVKDQIERLAEETGAFLELETDPIVGFEQGDPEITCAGTWALVNSVTLSADPGLVGFWWGPILLHYEDNSWVGVSANMHPFDGGRASPIDGTGPWPTNIEQCRQAPEDLRQAMGC